MHGGAVCCGERLQVKTASKELCDYKYVHIFDNRKDAKFKGITLGYDEFQQMKTIIEWMDKSDAYFKKVMLYVVSLPLFFNLH